MSGFLFAPTFTPPVPSIPLRTNGTVLTMVGGIPQFVAAGSGGGLTLGGRLGYASPAGAQNDVNPAGGFPTNIGRLVVTLAAGDAAWGGLLAGDPLGQLLLLTNGDAANSLTLNANDAGSAAANRFLYQFNIVLGPGVSKLLCYDGVLAKWLIA